MFLKLLANTLSLVGIPPFYTHVLNSYKRRGALIAESMQQNAKTHPREA